MIEKTEEHFVIPEPDTSAITSEEDKTEGEKDEEEQVIGDEDPRLRAVQQDSQDDSEADNDEEIRDQLFGNPEDGLFSGLENQGGSGLTSIDSDSETPLLDYAFSQLNVLNEDREGLGQLSDDISLEDNVSAIDLALAMGVALNPIDTTPLGEMDLTKTTIGALSVRLGVLEVDDVHRILQIQNESGGHFGEIVENLGLLTPTQVESLLEVQKIARDRI